MELVGTIKMALIHLFATEMRFCKFSLFPNGLYSLERKARNAGNFKIFENFKFCLSSCQRLYLNMTYKQF